MTETRERIEKVTISTFKEIQAGIEAINRQFKYIEHQSDILKSINHYEIGNHSSAETIDMYCDMLAKQVERLGEDVEKMLEDFNQKVEAIKKQEALYKLTQGSNGMAACRG